MSAWIITSSVLILVVIALRYLFQGKISRRLQYALWGLVLLKLLLPFSFLETPFSVMNIVPVSNLGEQPVYVLPFSTEPAAEAPGITMNNSGTVTDNNSLGHAVLAEDGTTVTRYLQKMNVSQIFHMIWLTGSHNDSLNTTILIDSTNLDSCIAAAILDANAVGHHNADLATEAHNVLKTVENGSTITVYAMALYMEFGYAGSGFFDTGGSHMPVAITFRKNPAGEYKLQEYWVPQDGNGYGPSIKASGILGV